MSESAFHLTPLDVRKQEFRRSLRGYEPVGVEDFRGRVADELERILREKSVLEERLSALGEQLQAYRERERAMNEALVEHGLLAQDPLQLVGHPGAKILDPERLVAAQAAPELLLPDVERGEMEGGLAHAVVSLGPNRTVPKRITVAPSSTAVP